MTDSPSHNSAGRLDSGSSARHSAKVQRRLARLPETSLALVEITSERKAEGRRGSSPPGRDAGSPHIAPRLTGSDALGLAQKQVFYPITKALMELFQLLGDGKFLASALGV